MMQKKYLQDCQDHIPILREVILLANNIIYTQEHLDITIFNQTKGTPYANTEQRTGRLNSQTIADVRKYESATTEDLFNLNSYC